MNDIVIPTTTKKRKKTRVASRVGSGSVDNYVCITRGLEVKRVTRTVAAQLVLDGFSYCPRSLWKKQVRDIKGYVAPVVVEQKESKVKAKKVKTDKPRIAKGTK